MASLVNNANLNSLRSPLFASLIVVWALGKILKGYVVNGGEGIQISRCSTLEDDSKELGENRRKSPSTLFNKQR